ncbi:Testis-expressed sequence 264 protein [Liparis tanakae]|uniref:Testis-expressed sequence 264 protein n=1 Tax=Liparis tanakae TaxID=230148 RepID=A0A4Z2J6U4_9TELE|nr:Testis-expressed sequence 264 protein [Liparis tanakae]
MTPGAGDPHPEQHIYCCSRDTAGTGRPAEKCRYVVGSVLCEGEEKPDEELQKMYEKFGFKVFSLPEVSHAVTTSFTCTTPLSHVVGPYRVYPRLASYIEVQTI